MNDRARHEFGDTDRRLLRHFLAALAYRTQKAVRDAPDEFATRPTSSRTSGPRLASAPHINCSGI